MPKNSLVIYATAIFLWTLVLPVRAHDAKEIAEDAQRHRALAEAQTYAARCFEENRPKAACVEEMNATCAGLAIGKYCGLREEAAASPIKSFKVTAQANLSAAQCMEAHRPYEVCLKDLQPACKGLGIGKFCGMIHSHSD